jgi:hypothetical protein
MGILVLEVFVFALVAHASMAFLDQPARQLFIGGVSMASLISMFASPLAVMVRFPKLRARLVSSSSELCCRTNSLCDHISRTLRASSWSFRVW